MLAWATAKVTLVGVPRVAPDVARSPAGMVRVSVTVGTKGAAAAKVSVLAAVFFQVPATTGSNVGTAVTVATGSDSVTVTTWFDGTSVAPVAGTVATTAIGCTADDGVEVAWWTGVAVAPRWVPRT